MTLSDHILESHKSFGISIYLSPRRRHIWSNGDPRHLRNISLKVVGVDHTPSEQHALLVIKLSLGDTAPRQDSDSEKPLAEMERADNGRVKFKHRRALHFRHRECAGGGESPG